jgi:hypothetical protein
MATETKKKEQAVAEALTLIRSAVQALDGVPNMDDVRADLDLALTQITAESKGYRVRPCDPDEEGAPGFALYDGDVMIFTPDHESLRKIRGYLQYKD